MADGGRKAASIRLRRLAGGLALSACLALGAVAGAQETMPLPELRVHPPESAPVPGTGVATPGNPPPLRILFEAGDDTVSVAYAALLALVARRLGALDGGRVRIRAYAPATGDDGRAARRLSLDRALAVRRQLIEAGLGAARIDLLALGGLTVAGPVDRVDVGMTP